MEHLTLNEEKKILKTLWKDYRSRRGNKKSERLSPEPPMSSGSGYDYPVIEDVATFFKDPGNSSSDLDETNSIVLALVKAGEEGNIRDYVGSFYVTSEDITLAILAVDYIKDKYYIYPDDETTLVNGGYLSIVFSYSDKLIYAIYWCENPQITDEGCSVSSVELTNLLLDVTL